MQIELEVKANYPAPGVNDEDVPELELNYVKHELQKVLGGGASLHITLRWQKKDGTWKILRS